MSALVPVCFACVWAAAGPAFRWPLVACVVAAPSLILVTKANRAGRPLAARLLFYGAGYGVLLATSTLIGLRAGFQLYFLVAAPLTYLLFDERRRRLRLFLAILGAFLFLGVRLLVPVDGVLHLPLPAWIATAIDMSSIIVTAWLLGLTAYLYVGYTLRAEEAAAAAHARSEQLLLNILPGPIAERLKRERSVIADGFDAVTVLFADIVGFTPLSASMTPRELVELLNEVFSTFDAMARRHGLEKIKTIGDAYMVVGGLPEPRAGHAAAVAAMALEMHEAVARLGGGRLLLRIGIHTGPAVAGVIGTSKFSYDLWGDTVNTAARMESHGAPGGIQITDACRAALGEAFAVEERGVVDIKGKGPMHTWWLKGSGGIPAV